MFVFESKKGNQEAVFTRNCFGNSGINCCPFFGAGNNRLDYLPKGYKAVGIAVKPGFK
jgi:hypothetical protein